ncbi:signal peptidase II [Candidatus Peribacteria bacterium]|nr:signal peptidase II [Candidatus Peribacteria bacterium]MBT4021415.1 signal peptidase II [Candidatus Peribacteria bacterium]MBT4240431.1 signal peptidase II [Candidatus Peribacteria bacterium]MBT4474513.1 signal peptidase II [Candidatus Peribacteria bacterium]
MIFISALSSFLISVAIRLMVESSAVDTVENSGIAFGIDLPFSAQKLLIPIALILVLYFGWQSRKDKIQSIGFGLIIGGAFANILDRFDDGFVTDFIDVGWWPSFNVADSCITVGVGLLLVVEFLRKK